MNQFSHLLLSPNASIREALKIISSGAMKIAVIADKDNRLIGTISDGDIRRGLLDNMSLDDSIEMIYSRTPTFCNIADSQETVLQTAIEKNLYQIPIVDNERRIVGIEELNKLLDCRKRSTPVVLMAGGRGQRLKPLTDNIPKPLLTVGSRPILETILVNFRNYGFTNFIFSVNYKSEMIENHFGDGSAFNVSIEYVHEQRKMGTAGALGLMRERLNEPFFVMNGDLLTNVNFDHMLYYHQDRSAVATMGVRGYDFQVPYGVVNLNQENILSIKEKPVHKFFVNAGVYVLDPMVLEYIPTRTFDMTTLFDKLIADQHKAISFYIREYWLDIGYIHEYQKANEEYNVVF
ncbi:MAG: nucleotidyltransferase family protein [Victivallales bacterium]|nr:nucleotidyltransferase family protein [Victivallales bacterium]